MRRVYCNLDSAVIGLHASAVSNQIACEINTFSGKKVGIALALRTVTMFGSIDCERHIDWSR